MISYKNNPYPYIKKSNILVLCSRHEGLPNVLIESAVLKLLRYQVIARLVQKKFFKWQAGALFKVSNSKHLAKKVLYFKKKGLEKA